MTSKRSVQPMGRHEVRAPDGRTLAVDEGGYDRAGYGGSDARPVARLPT
jgi:hypothetical protein